MRPITISSLCLTLFLALAPAVSSPVQAAVAATAGTPAEVAQQARAKWTRSREAYLASVQPFQAQPGQAALIGQYTAALDKAGASLEHYIALKLATPATPAAKLTPAVDRLIKDLAALRTLRGKAKGPLANVLGTALSQHNEAAQTALKNMR
jgi:hypothetical protein